MTTLDLTTIAGWPASNEEVEFDSAADVPVRFSRQLTRSQIVDATTRLIARRGDHRIPWPSIAVEAGC